ncbi:hypothetical protein [uncultured Streptomyces sp.]|uniref:hypothetical protein n=1 Tax=uncultured Streptomyces sp. TaxID=174707 RepID=UPI002616D65C|nr:hypothetical protein [uncultured Streptomyces sp.]
MDSESARRAPGGNGAGAATEAVTGPEVTYTECRQCGTLIAGLDGRYACPGCGWVNDHSEGHRALPTAEDDPDYPGHAPQAPRG